MGLYYFLMVHVIYYFYINQTYICIFYFIYLLQPYNCIMNYLAGYMKCNVHVGLKA